MDKHTILHNLFFYITIYRGRIKYKPMNSYKLCKPLYYMEANNIDTYNGSLIELRYIWKLIIFIHYDYDFILGNKMKSSIF